MIANIVLLLLTAHLYTTTRDGVYAALAGIALVALVMPMFFG